MTVDIRNQDNQSQRTTGDASDPTARCPVCESTMRCERRGDDWFCWCANGKYNIGCSGQHSFGKSAAEARCKIHVAFNNW